MDDNGEMIILLNAMPFFNISLFLHIFKSFSSVDISLYNNDDRNYITMLTRYATLLDTNTKPVYVFVSTWYHLPPFG